MNGKVLTKGAECDYKECNRERLKQFRPELGSKDMTGEILQVLPPLKDINNVTNERVLLWDQRVETQKVHR